MQNHNRPSHPSTNAGDEFIAQVAEGLREIGWRPPPLPERFLLAYLEGTLSQEESGLIRHQLRTNPETLARLQSLQAQRRTGAESGTIDE